MEDHLIRIDPGSNAFRFYRLALWPDLFGGVSLAREWGRTGQPGKLRLDRYDSEQEAGRALARLAAAKLRRGYRQIMGGEPTA
jgi:predicted DNA-binding WGR domain protein